LQQKGRHQVVEEEPGTTMAEVDPLQAQRLLEAGAILVDVREPSEWQAGRAPQAIHIPMGQLGERLSELAEDRQLVVVCRSGARSAASTRALTEAGFQAANLAGGMKAWAGAGLAVVDSDGAPGTVI
jgi:rhodanese-related sulfurtransferase